MKTATLTRHLQVDDYLDLLNLAVTLGDKKWQKEIKRKLEYMYPSTQQA